MKRLLLAAFAALALAGCASPGLTVDNATAAQCKLGMDTPATVLATQQDKHGDLDLKIVNVYHSKDGKTDYVVIAVTNQDMIAQGYTKVLVLTVKEGCVVSQAFAMPEEAAALDGK